MKYMSKRLDVILSYLLLGTAWLLRTDKLVLEYSKSLTFYQFWEAGIQKIVLELPI